MKIAAVAMVLFWLATVSAIVWVLAHFIAKFW